MNKWIKICGIGLIAILISGCSKDDNISNITESTTEQVTAVGTESNTSKKYSVYISADSGFYDEGFDLEIKAEEGLEVYYSLDGSEPNKTSTKYATPIYITDATNNANVYSMRTDIGLGYGDEFSDDYVDGVMIKLHAPDYNVDKCTVMKIAVYDNDELVLRDSRVFFVGFNEKEIYDGISVISLVTAPENLFDYEKGIYVLGKCEEEYNNDLPIETYRIKWDWYKGNYSNKGIDWEREAKVDYFDIDRNHILDSLCGIRIQGNSSPGYAQKSFNVYARKEYGGKRTFKADIFENGFKPHKFTVFAGSDDMITKMKDFFMSETAKTLDFTTMKYVPTMLFLNGEYWGMYYVAEKYDKDYLKYHYGVNDDNVIIVKEGEIEEGKTEDMELYESMRRYMTETDLSIDANYQKACELIDIDSFIDYVATEIYICRRYDWPEGDCALWRVREVEDNPYGDGKWRYMMFDVNSKCMDSVDEDITINSMGNDPLLACFIANKDFLSKYTGKICTLGNTVLSARAFDDFRKEYLEAYEDVLLFSHKRWYGDRIDEAFLCEYIDVYGNFYDNRLEKMLDSTNFLFSMNAKRANLNIIINDETYGNVDIDRCPLVFDNNKWNGIYLTGVCLTVNVRANEGHNVVGMKVNGEFVETDRYEFVLEETNQTIEIIIE